MGQGADGLHWNLNPVRELSSPLVVDVDDAPSRSPTLKEASLGREVALHGLVEVEVIPLQIGENGYGEVHAADAIEGRGVGTDLGHRRGDALLKHACEQSVKHRCLDRC